MNPTDPREWHRLFNAALNDELSNADHLALAAVLKSSGEARQLWFLYHDNECSLAEIKRPVEIKARKPPLSWVQWRPLTAAAAGIAFGMFCTSVVFGFVSPRMGAVKKVPLTVFDAGLEDEKQTLHDAIPDRVGQWGMDEAKVVTTENDVKPLQGRRMMRLEPIPREKSVKNHTSRAYQVLDLRTLPSESMNGDSEVQVTASFCATNSDVSSRYLTRAVALDENPEQATKNFWSKVESDGVVSVSQRFDTKPGDPGWHSFSMKLRLPPGSKTLVLIFGAVPPEDAAQPASVHYLDEVQVSLLSSETPLP